MTSPLLDSEDWKAVICDWNRVQDAYFQIRECDVVWNLTRQSLVSYRFTKLAATPVLYGVASETGLSAGLSPKTLWLSLWGDIAPERAENFVGELLALTEREKKSRCSIGADEFHFVPGVPLNGNKSFMDALLKSGFQTAEECDFVGAIESEIITTYISDALSGSRQRGWRLEPARSTQEQKALLSFLSTEFPGRWTREYEFYLKNSDSQRATWSSLLNESTQIIGFARTAVRHLLQPDDQGWTPAALRLPQSRDRQSGWATHDGCLGPIGVAVSQRGQGTGRILLGLVLHLLRTNGAKRTCIDWTDALKYYEPLQFDVVRRYGTAWRVANP